MSIFNLFKLDYWFTQPYIAFGVVKWSWAAAFLILVLGGLVLRMIYNAKRDKSYRDLLRRFSNLSFTGGSLGLLWLFFRQQNVPFLSWRFWLLVILFAMLCWLTRLLNYALRRLPAIQKENQARELKEKYLP